MGRERFFIGSTDGNSYFTGDPVLVSSANLGFIAPWPGSSNPQPMLGIFDGCEFFNSGAARNQFSPFFVGPQAGSTAAVTAYVITDPEMLFIAQTSTTGSLLGSSDIGLNIFPLPSTMASTSGNQFSGVSAVSLNSSSVTASSSLPFRIVDLYSNFAPPGGSVNGTDNTVQGNILVVAPNNWVRHAGVTGVST